MTLPRIPLFGIPLFGIPLRSLLLAVLPVLALAVTGCGGGDEKTEGKTPETKTEAAEAGGAGSAGAQAGGDGAGETTPSASDLDQTPVANAVALPEYTRYFPEDAILAVVVRPAGLLNSEFVNSLQAGDLVSNATAELGVDPSTIAEAALAFRVPSDGSGPPQPAGVFRFTEAVEADALGEKFSIAAEFESAESNGNSYLRGQGADGNTWALYQPAADAIVIATEPQLLAAFERQKGSGAVAKRLARADTQQDFVLVLSTRGQEALISQMQNMAERGMAPPQLAALGDLPQKIDGITVTAALQGDHLLSVEVDTVDETAAQQIEQQAMAGQQALTGFYQQNRDQLGALPELTEVVDKLVNGIAIERTANTVRLTVPSPGDLTALAKSLQPAIASARQAAKLAEQRNALRQIGLAFHNYHDAYNAFPPGDMPAARDDDGNLKHSWRVHLLPFLEYAPLYNELNLEEPWNSDQNKQVLEAAETPARLAIDDISSSKTRIRMFSGPGTLLDGSEKINMGKIQDGLSYTIMAVVVSPEKAVTWYEPGNDIPIDSEDLKQELGAPGPQGYMVLMCDGAVQFLDPDISNEDLRALVTRAGQEDVDF